VDGCDTTAWYRNPGEKVSRCGPHKLAGMVQTSVVTCKAAGCTTMVTKKISVFCQAHKPTEMSSDDSDVSEYSDDGSVAGQSVVSTRVTRSTESSLPRASAGASAPPTSAMSFLQASSGPAATSTPSTSAESSLRANAATTAVTTSESSGAESASVKEEVVPLRENVSVRIPFHP